MSRLSNDPWSHQTGPLNFDTMVLNSDSGDVTSLHSYFNKHLMSVQQLNSILGSVSRQIRAMPQVEVFLPLLICVQNTIRSKLMRRGARGRRRRRRRRSKVRMMKQLAFMPQLIYQNVQLFILEGGCCVFVSRIYIIHVDGYDMYPKHFAKRDIKCVTLYIFL